MSSPTVIWLVVVEGAGLEIAVWQHAPAWMLILCTAVYSLTVLVYLGVYLFFLRKYHGARRIEIRVNEKGPA